MASTRVSERVLQAQIELLRLRLRLGLQIAAQQRFQRLVVAHRGIRFAGLVVRAHEHAVRLLVVGLAFEKALQRSDGVGRVAELELQLGQLSRRAEKLAGDAFAVLFDNAENTCYEATISLTAGKLLSWKAITGVQPTMTIT